MLGGAGRLPGAAGSPRRRGLKGFGRLRANRGGLGVVLRPGVGGAGGFVVPDPGMTKWRRRFEDLGVMVKLT